MDEGHDSDESPLRRPIAVNAWLHACGAVAACVATHGHGAIRLGDRLSPLEQALADLFAKSIWVADHLPCALIRAYCRLGDFLEWARLPLSDWTRLAIAVWVDFQLWNILLVVAWGVWRRRRGLRDAPLRAHI